MTESPICLLYWGRKGGGSVLTEQLEIGAKALGYSVYVSSRPKGNGVFLANWRIMGWYKHRQETIQCLKELGVKIVIVTMASPWDLFLKRKLERGGIQISRFIHDARPHPGELFPPRFWTYLLMRDADRIIVFSEYVANYLSNYLFYDETKLVISVLPSAPLLINLQDHSSPHGKRLLFIGRGRRYKGQKMLEKAWNLVPGESNQLYIVGKGHSKPENENRIFQISEWVSDVEFQKYISSCDLVVLPYLEASQSGIIPIAHMLGKPVLVTPVGGLPEQVVIGVNGLVSKSIGANDFAQAICEALDISWQIPDYDNEFLTKKLLLDSLSG